MKTLAFLIAGCLTVLAAASHAEPTSGTPMERSRYRTQLEAAGGFHCPADTSRMFAEERQHAIEFCTDANGVRHGYFLRWQPNNRDWAELGYFNKGRRIGVWHSWSQDGKEIVEVAYQRGKAMKTTTFSLNDSVVAQR